MLLYQVLARKNFRTGNSIYYPQIASCTPVDFDEICSEIAAKCTLTRPDVEAVLIDLEEHILLHLKEGQTVRLGRLGSFRLSLHNEGAFATPEDAVQYSQSGFQSVKVRFTPGTYIRRALSLKNLTFSNIHPTKANSTNGQAAAG